ncbi:CRISPR-associated protein GSU0054/csb2, Dpsyc system [Alkalispirochaeta americana]|uniref:CRISPR-associated protein GSU0054/csb2, Dpsyc system n=1 Tax=Alkalispirochaeta americana TaxID=159291 RepID=A0A1N6T795_9SPIO|nr:type I-U CRISPR-associated protein Csb2 [Alkalispirochaeta americana]SIQ49193.1 CRISPR-associated protein GSU0054/csb2, Dpsyc system [Alkalispirochaeta americana]
MAFSYHPETLLERDSSRSIAEARFPGGFSVPEEALTIETAGTVFSPRIISLTKTYGKDLQLSQTTLLSQALRATLIPLAEERSQRARELASGHAKGGEPLRETHVAYAPLCEPRGRAGSLAVTGAAVVLPRGLAPAEEEELRQILDSAAQGERGIVLTLGRLGLFGLKPLPAGEIFLSSGGGSDRIDGISEFDEPEDFTGPSQVWDSITPVVMDRRQRNRQVDADEWARKQVSLLCTKIGLPEPEQVLVDSVPFHPGSLAVKRFPPIRLKDGSSRRMVHVRCVFRRMVQGPLLLGSGRFRGYGLCKPRK